MSTARPALRGQTILLTRPSLSSTLLRDQLLGLGASVVHMPTVQLRARELGSDALQPCGYSALAFSSQNAWHFYKEAGLASPERSALPHFSIGPATTQAIASEGPVIQASERSGKGLAEAVKAHFGGAPDKPVLFPCSSGARHDLEEVLIHAGAAVHRLEIYEPFGVNPGPIPTEVALPNWVVFASPSAIPSYKEHLHPIPGVHVACMGPTTFAAAAAAGLKVELVPAKPGTQELCDALVEWQQRRVSN